MKQDQETITKTIDETLLIPILGKGKKLYHYTSAAGLQGICSGGILGHRKKFFKRHNGISSGD